MKEMLRTRILSEIREEEKFKALPLGTQAKVLNIINEEFDKAHFIPNLKSLYKRIKEVKEKDLKKRGKDASD